MKTLPGTMKVVALAGLSVAIVFALRSLAQTPAAAAHTDPEIDTFVLKIKKKAGEYHGLRDSTLKGEADFVALLCDSNRAYEKSQKLHFKSNGGKEFDLPADCNTPRSAISPQAKLEIKTDKVTVSDTAKGIEAELTVIGSHVTIQIASRSQDDIRKVLDSLAP